MPIGVQNQLPPTNPWAASQIPMSQVQVPSYYEAISTEKSPLPDGYGQHVQGQMTFGVPGNGINQPVTVKSSEQWLKAKKTLFTVCSQWQIV